MIDENSRQRLYRVGAHCAWWGAFVWTAVLTWVNLTRPATAMPSAFQRVSGLIIILLIGLAIALGTALSRTRLGDTIGKVFETGLSAAISLHAAMAGDGSSGRRDVCIIRTDLDGMIESIEHGEVIGWEDELLIGHNIDSFIADRFLWVNRAALAQFHIPSVGTAEAGLVITFSLLLRAADGNDRAVRMTITRLGDALIKTIVPLGEPVA